MVKYQSRALSIPYGIILFAPRLVACLLACLVLSYEMISLVRTKLIRGTVGTLGRLNILPRIPAKLSFVRSFVRSFSLLLFSCENSSDDFYGSQ